MGGVCVHQLLPGVPTSTMVTTAATGTVEQREHHLGLSSTGPTTPVQIDRTLTFSVSSTCQADAELRALLSHPQGA